MAYAILNQSVISPPRGDRYIHKRLRMTVDGSGNASAQAACPPGRIIAVQYGIYTASTESFAAATSGALTVKADTTDGVQVWTDGDLSSVPTGPLPLGTTAKDEGNAATAATDAFSGGLPVRAGFFAAIASGTAAEVITVDVWVRLCTFLQVTLISQSGADGSGAVTRTIRLAKAGVLAAVALDYQNMPATTDVIIKADSTSGAVLFTNANSATDLAPTLLGRPGADEAVNASAATDGTECGNAFRTGLFIDVAQADAFTSGNEKIVAELWIDT